jgi:uncharacterized protein
VTTVVPPQELIPGLYEVGSLGPRLVGSCCERCHGYTFPSRTVCPRCKLRSMAPVRFGERGVLFSFTVCHVAPSGWQAPYLQAYIELPEGVRVFSLVASDVPATIDALEPGMDMGLVVEPVEPGGGLLTYKYRPIEPHA